MGTWLLKKRFWLILPLFFGGFVIFISLGNYNNPRRKIYYRYHSKLNLGYVFGFLPSKYSENYSEYILEENESYLLKNIDYLEFPAKNHNYILFTDKESSGVEQIIFDSDSMFYKVEDVYSLLSSQFNHKMFNKYLDYREVKDTEKKLKIFYQFIADFDNSKFEIVENINQYERHRKLANSNTECYKILSENYAPNFTKNKYVWFKYIGLFEIKIDSINDQINDELIFGPITLNIVGLENCSEITIESD